MNRNISISVLAVILIGFFTAGFISIGSDRSSKNPVLPENLGTVVHPVSQNSDLPPIYTDNFDGANDTTSLKARGYKVWYRGSGPQGTFATWFQGDGGVFPAFNGPATGYVACNYQVVTGTNNIDSWLVIPRVTGGLVAGDSLIFRIRSTYVATTNYPDSFRVMYSAIGDSIPEGTWVELGRFRALNPPVGQNTWERRGFRAPTAGVNARFAIRYNVVNGGPNGSNSDYSGIDALEIIRTSAPSTCNNYSSQWCALGAFPVLPAATYFDAASWVGDTLYVQAPSTAGAGATTIYRYTYGGSWSTGVPCLTAVSGASMSTAGGKLYLIGGGASVTVGGTTVQEYNPATGTWTAKAPLPAALSAHGSVTWGDSVIFVVGGPYTGAATNLAVHYYRVASNTWGTIAASLPSGQGRRTFAMGITGGNKIVISCGFNTVYLNSTYVGTIGANASLITWTAAPNAPVALSRPGGVGFNNYFYLVGGDTNTTAVKNDKVFVFNSQTNTWFYTIPSNPNPVSNMMNAITAKCINDTVKIFQAGGYTAASAASNVFAVLGCGPTITGIPNITNEIPSSYSLSQNYPNPFNPSTKISFALPKAGNVKLIVFDLLGREVATLVNEYRTSGNHVVDFNAVNFASGVYFYRIEAGDFTATKKMLLVK
ncbi:MAG: T9SS C-terminal target domain-containing protein [Ignavibacteriae bacterium]|nr:MAG: T9SS C-terminal target domain-containing protein [Ignavibacteriota bacterium]